MRLAEQAPALFAPGMAWQRAAEEWALVTGLVIESWQVDQRFTADGMKFRVQWIDGADFWSAVAEDPKTGRDYFISMLGDRCTLNGKPAHVSNGGDTMAMIESEDAKAEPIYIPWEDLANEMDLCEGEFTTAEHGGR